jgi:hypothetical protein
MKVSYKATRRSESLRSVCLWPLLPTLCIQETPCDWPGLSRPTRSYCPTEPTAACAMSHSLSLLYCPHSTVIGHRSSVMRPRNVTVLGWTNMTGLGAVSRHSDVSKEPVASNCRNWTKPVGQPVRVIAITPPHTFSFPIPYNSAFINHPTTRRYMPQLLTNVLLKPQT